MATTTITIDGTPEMTMGLTCPLCKAPTSSDTKKHHLSTTKSKETICPATEEHRHDLHIALCSKLPPLIRISTPARGDDI
jgi:hypothetical protein